MSTPSQCRSMIDACIRLQMPGFVKGPVGAGKSQVVAQACDAAGMQLIDIRLSQMDPTDIKGFPSPDAAKNVMRWLPPDFFPPMKAKTKGVLFFDELPSAPQAVQAACYQLFLDRKVGSYVLPDGWTMLAAGNRDVDRSIVNRIPAALNNRMVHIDYEIDLDDFVAHAMAAGMSAENIAWLRFKSNLLHSFDPTQNPAAFPTPRGWFSVDKVMKAGLSESTQLEMITGIVGKGAAMEHKAFLDVIAELPSIDEIKIAPDSTLVPQSPATLFALTTSLGMATDKASFPRFMQYVERMEREWQVVYIRDCLKRANEIKLTPTFTAWGLANADVVI